MSIEIKLDIKSFFAGCIITSSIFGSYYIGSNKAINLENNTEVLENNIFYNNISDKKEVPNDTADVIDSILNRIAINNNINLDNPPESMQQKELSDIERSIQRNINSNMNNIVIPGMQNSGDRVQELAAMLLTQRQNDNPINSNISRNNGPHVELSRTKSGENLGINEQKALLGHILQNIPDEFTITYESTNEIGEVYVFTDPTCPFCRNLHRDIERINNAGYTVHYFFFPREGLNGNVHRQLTSAWCSEDTKGSLDKLFNGQRLPSPNCRNIPEDKKRMGNIVAQHYILANSIGVTNTPTYVMKNGNIDMGYRNLNNFISKLENMN